MDTTSSPSHLTPGALTAAERQEAYGWIADCWDDAPGPDDLTDEQIVALIDRHCCGGLTEFLTLDGMPADEAAIRARQLRGDRADKAILLAMHVASTGDIYFDVRPMLPPSPHSHLMHLAPYGTDFSQGVTFYREWITTC